MKKVMFAKVYSSVFTLRPINLFYCHRENIVIKFYKIIWINMKIFNVFKYFPR